MRIKRKTRGVTIWPSRPSTSKMLQLRLRVRLLMDTPMYFSTSIIRNITASSSVSVQLTWLLQYFLIDLRLISPCSFFLVDFNCLKILFLTTTSSSLRQPSSTSRWLTSLILLIEYTISIIKLAAKIKRSIGDLMSPKSTKMINWCSLISDLLTYMKIKRQRKVQQEQLINLVYICRYRQVLFLANYFSLQTINSSASSTPTFTLISLCCIYLRFTTKVRQPPIEQSTKQVVVNQTNTEKSEDCNRYFMSRDSSTMISMGFKMQMMDAQAKLVNFQQSSSKILMSLPLSCCDLFNI